MINLIKKFFVYKKKIINKPKSFSELKKIEGIKKLFSLVGNYNENSEIRYVGGCVRKILCKEIVDDIDLAVNLNPKEICKLLEENNIKFYETGIEHGTITVIIDNNKFEITSLRKDIVTDGRHAKVLFSKNWLEDASRRDFTINSIYSDIDGNLFDPYNGKQDLEIGKVKFIGNTSKRIQEDYLRILRYVRFFINYNKLSHDEDLKKSIKQNLNGISNISSERLLDEFKKIIKSKNFLKLFKDEFCLQVVILIFPQFKNINLFKNLNEFAEQNFEKVDYIILISLMLIDESDNVDYFLFKFNISNKDKKRIIFLKNFVKDQNNKMILSKKNLWKTFYYNGKETLFDLMYFEIFRSKKYNKKLVDLLYYFQDKEVPIIPIGPKTLMNKYNIAEGKELGEKFRKIENKWVDNDFQISENEILQLIKT